MTSPLGRLKLGVTRNWKRTALSIVATYGLLWSLIEPFNGLMPSDRQFEGAGKYAALIALALAGGLYWLFPKTRIKLSLHLADSTVEVLFGDLFKETGQKVIPVNDCFDSQLGKIVAPNSLHGLLISKEFHGVSKDFDDAVAVALGLAKGKSVTRPDGGKPARYPIGTTAHLQWKGSEYYLVAVAQTDRTTSIASASVAEFWQALEGLWMSARVHANNGDVVVPLLGSGLARVGLPQDQLLYFLISSFVAETKRQKVTRHLKIVLHESVFEHVDLSEFERNWNS
jgi:hypothetical protein